MTNAYWSDALHLTPAASICHDSERNAFVFLVSGTEVLALYHNGDVAVHGRLVVDRAGGSDEGPVFSALKTFCTEVTRCYGASDDLRARLREWCNRFGADLTPPIDRADSYGEGVRDCKAAIGKILDRHGA